MTNGAMGEPPAAAPCSEAEAELLAQLARDYAPRAPRTSKVARVAAVLEPLVAEGVLSLDEHTQLLAVLAGGAAGRRARPRTAPLEAPHELVRELRRPLLRPDGKPTKGRPRNKPVTKTATPRGNRKRSPGECPKPDDATHI